MGESGDILNAQLWDAVWEEDIERAKHLLEKGASVDARKKSILVSVDWECVSDIEMKKMSFAVKIELHSSDDSVFSKEQGNGWSPVKERSFNKWDRRCELIWVCVTVWM